VSRARGLNCFSARMLITYLGLMCELDGGSLITAVTTRLILFFPRRIFVRHDHSFVDRILVTQKAPVPTIQSASCCLCLARGVHVFPLTTGRYSTSVIEDSDPDHILGHRYSCPSLRSGNSRACRKLHYPVIAVTAVVVLFEVVVPARRSVWSGFFFHRWRNLSSSPSVSAVRERMHGIVRELVFNIQHE